MIPVVHSEAENFTCEQIIIEIDKCNAFIREVNTRNREFTGGDVLAFLGDFGIGDSWEVGDAIASATNRISQLEKLKSEKCGSEGKLIGYHAEQQRDGTLKTTPVYKDSK
ncbi:MAG: hypothetical protein KAQ89_03390 [Planctomycetes bacterium]|nr:hypothetical protein [Planctomycetota bacterium]